MNISVSVIARDRKALLNFERATFTKRKHISFVGATSAESACRPAIAVFAIAYYYAKNTLILTGKNNRSFPSALFKCRTVLCELRHASGAYAGGEAPGAQLVVGEAGHEVTDGGSGARPGEVEGPGPQDGLGEGEVDGGGLDGEHGDVAALDAAVVLLDGASPKRGVGAPGREAWKAPAMYRSMEGWLPLTART